MKIKIIIFLAVIAIVFFGKPDSTHASNCSGRCGLMCTVNENVSSDAFEYCDAAGEQCCKPKPECDPTMPGCGGTTSAKAPATVGNACGGTPDSFCEAGSFFCSTGRTRDFTKGSVSCVSGSICCKNDVKTGTSSTYSTTANSSANYLNEGDACGASATSSKICNTTLRLSCVCGTDASVAAACRCQKSSGGGTSGLTSENKSGGGTSGLTPEANQYDSPALTQADFDTIAGQTGLPAPVGGIKSILKNLLIWLLEIVGVVALIGFVIAGTQYILASGDEKLAEAGKKNMTYAIIGMVVVLSSFVVIKAIDYALRASSSAF
ncbi:MAG: pilin [Candidatus Moranbacteria bacterium]|nr:pilin [Candidatus Moranbacteria bacterium]